jgi:hypothetical protein
MQQDFVPWSSGFDNALEEPVTSIFRVENIMKMQAEGSYETMVEVRPLVNHNSRRPQSVCLCSSLKGADILKST